jgi:hypothetical protein
VPATHRLRDDVTTGVPGSSQNDDLSHAASSFRGVYFFAERTVDTWYSATDVAIPALRDSVDAEIGIETI